MPSSPGSETESLENAWSEVNNFDVPKYINSPSWPTGTDIAPKIHSVLDLWARNTPLRSVITILPSLFWQSLTLDLGALWGPSWTVNLTHGFYLILHVTAIQSVYCLTMVISCLGSLAAWGLLMALAALEVASTSVSWTMFFKPSCSASCFKLFQNCFTPLCLLEWEFLPCNTHNCLGHFQSLLW